MALPSASPTYDAPTSATTSETLVWLLAAPDTPAWDGWACAVTLTPAAGSVVTVTATQEMSGGADFRVTVSATDSAALGAGNVGWVGMATKGVEAYCIGRGRIALSAASGRTANETALAALDAMLAGRAASGLASYVIAGRQVQYMEPSELQRWRGIYAQRVQTERFGDSRQMRARFSRAS